MGMRERVAKAVTGAAREKGAGKRKLGKQDSLAATMSSKSDRTFKVIRFSNNDVPNFLAKLEKFEKASRRSRLVIS